jgi:Tfp pilus assembly protein PilX
MRIAKERLASKERGISLIIALLSLLVLSVLAAGLMFVTQTEIWTTANYRELAQARYAAEAGVQSTINWLQYTYTAPTTFGSYNSTTNPVQYNNNPVILSGISSISSNYPDTTQQTAYSTALSGQAVPGLANASFSTAAELINMIPSSSVSWLNSGVIQTWQITSQGSVNGVRAATVQVVATYQRTGTPVFTAPVVATATGCTSGGTAPVYFNGPCKTNTGANGPCTDSYNSSSGPYSSTNSTASGGNIATNGFVSLNGATVDGNIYSSMSTAVGTSCPTDGVSPGGGTYSSIARVNTVNEPCPWGCATCGSTACYPPGVTPDTTNHTLNSSFCPTGGTACSPHSPATIPLYDGTTSGRTSVNQYNLAPGTYGNLSWSDDSVLYLQGGGTYNINSLNFGSTNGQIVVSPPGSSVVINITGAGTLPSLGGASGNVPTAIYEAGLGGFNLCNNGLPGNPGQLYTSGSTLGANCNVTSTGAPSAGNPTANPISGLPANMQIVYAGTGQMRVGGAPNSLVIYMPNAPFYQPGGAVGLNGSIVSKSFVDDSNSPFHYDQALQTSVFKPGSYMLVGFSWSKF